MFETQRSTQLITTKPYLLHNTTNGLYLNTTYFSEEILTLILSHVEIKHILKCGLVCRKWNYIIKTFPLWSLIYERIYKSKAKKLPWYLYFCLFSTNYFDNNLLLNGNGQLGLKHWQCKIWDGDNYIEEIPLSADLLPENVREFNNCTSCFVTSYFSGFKTQRINYNKSKLFCYILDNYKPYIYLSEWTTGRADCSCVYKLQCGFVKEDGSQMNSTKPFASCYKKQWDDGKWEKMEILITDYPSGSRAISFENRGSNTQSWKGHYGVKMAGGVIRFLFKSMEPLLTDAEGNVITKPFEKINFISNGLPQHEVVDYYELDYIWTDNNEECYYFMP
ncbi:hypothetical protein FQA39_LY02776 [Lamprigera yunnana]|nr:hypothetical protein FQA39_LY02776 [Lamprigera yunnana]